MIQHRKINNLNTLILLLNRFDCIHRNRQWRRRISSLSNDDNDDHSDNNGDKHDRRGKYRTDNTDRQRFNRRRLKINCCRYGKNTTRKKKKEIGRKPVDPEKFEFVVAVNDDDDVDVKEILSVMLDNVGVALDGDDADDKIVWLSIDCVEMAVEIVVDEYWFGNIVALDVVCVVVSTNAAVVNVVVGVNVVVVGPFVED